MNCYHLVISLPAILVVKVKQSVRRACVQTSSYRTRSEFKTVNKYQQLSAKNVAKVVDAALSNGFR